MAEREPGFYWVRHMPTGAWSVAEYSGSSWLVVGMWYPRSDIDFAEIGERAERHKPRLLDDEFLKRYAKAISDEALPRLAELPTWRDPQPITDTQRTGEGFLVWIVTEQAQFWTAAHYSPDPLPRGSWVSDGCFWPAFLATHCLPLPPKVKP